MSSANKNNTTTTAAEPVIHALSCVNCRQRKVKCAKIYPCPHCVRGGLECVFPARKKDRAPRRTRNHELLNRLAKLEAIVSGQQQHETGGDGGDGDGAMPAAPLAIGDVGQHTSAAVVFGGGGGDVAAAAASAPLLPRKEVDLVRQTEKRCPTVAPVSQDDPAAKYVSGEFWANLSREVEGIKTALEGPSDDDDDGDDDNDDENGFEDRSPAMEAQIGGGHYSTPGSTSSSSVFLGILTAMHGSIASPPHPAPERIKKLRDLYFENVDPLMKILHRPTIEREFDVFIVNPDDNPPDRQTEALFFAMYFATVTSLSPERCVELFGEERGPLSARYRHGVEVALARADYLNNTSLETLQALTIYDVCLRNYAQSRASWALLALVYRLAQAIGLHRDGSGEAFSPYQAELRRRLWAQIVVLDVRASQDRGSEPMINEDDYNTLPPTNINDDDFNPDTSVPIPSLAVDGPTDITFSLCTYRCSSVFLYIHGPRSKFFKESSSSSSSGPSNLHSAAAPQQTSEEDIIARIKSLESEFVLPAAQHPDHYPSILAASVVRLTTLIFWLTIQYPFRTRQPTIKPRVPREHMLQTAVAIMDLQAVSPAPGRFAWWADGYVQWHPLAVALAELCVQTDGALVDRAWATVERVFPLWRHKVADRTRGALWRPIRKLYRRAREKRAASQLRRNGLPSRNTELPHVPPTPKMPSVDGVGIGGVAAGGGEEKKQQQQQQQLQQQPIAPVAAARQQVLFENAHNTSWTTIDFGAEEEPPTMATPAMLDDLNFGFASGGGGGSSMAFGEEATQMAELEMMDWSAWNDFVNDANVDLGDRTSPSSEGL